MPVSHRRYSGRGWRSSANNAKEGLTGPFAEQVGGILELTLRKYPDMPESEAPFIDDDAEMGTIAGRYLEHVLRGKRQQAQEHDKGRHCPGRAAQGDHRPAGPDSRGRSHATELATS